MYREILKSMGKNSLSSTKMTIIAFLSIILVVGVTNLINNRYGISYISYLAFLFAALLGLYIYRKKILEFRYSIIDDELIFEQISGKKIKPIVSVNIKRLLFLGKIAEENQYEGRCDKNYTILFNKKSPEAYVIYVKKDKEIIRILFQPTDKLVQLIKRHK